MRNTDKIANRQTYDSFIINVKYEVGYCDIDTKNILFIDYDDLIDCEDIEVTQETPKPKTLRYFKYEP